ncbi:MAG: hypothetical protein ACRDF5_10360, partial [bacterium]
MNRTAGKLRRWLDDPAAFAAEALGLPPWPHQAQILRSKAKIIVAVAARQVGKSMAAAMLALHRAFSTPRRRILICSPSLRQSSLMFGT